MDEKNKKELRLGYFYFSLFVVLILGGIITKRVFGHPEFMMLWHLPAAIFLIIGGNISRSVSCKLKLFNSYRKQI